MPHRERIGEARPEGKHRSGAPLFRCPVGGGIRMKAIGDAEILDRLVHADGVTSKMMGEAGLDRWAVMNSMALAFYAMKFDEPEKVLDRHLKVVGDVVRVYGRRMPEWCSLEALVNFEGFYPSDDDWMVDFMFAQDYLQHVIDLHTRENGGIDDRIIGEIGLFLDFVLASACMGYDSSKRALKEGRRLSEDALRYALENCTYQEGPEMES